MNVNFSSPGPCRYLTTLFLLFALGSSATALAARAIDSRATFVLEVNDRRVHYTTAFEPVMPGAEVTFSTSRELASRLTVNVNGVPVKREGRSFTWRAPAKAGLATAVVTLAPQKRTAKPDQVTVQLFIMVPASAAKNGTLNGYRIGNYPSPLRNLTTYFAPRGYIEVTPDIVNTYISPNFTLGQFLCKQNSGWPKYLVLQPRLITKLEELLLEVNAAGIEADTFVVMSGYRTPYYNAAIKNVPSSYHIYGGAADIYIDVSPRDGVMDDLNSDGKQNRADAAYLYNLADSFVTRRERPELVGGVGEYGSNAAHGPFVHIDVRGIRARWGHTD